MDPTKTILLSLAANLIVNSLLLFLLHRYQKTPWTIFDVLALILGAGIGSLIVASWVFAFRLSPLHSHP